MYVIAAESLFRGRQARSFKVALHICSCRQDAGGTLVCTGTRRVAIFLSMFKAGQVSVLDTYHKLVSSYVAFCICGPYSVDLLASKLPRYRCTHAYWIFEFQ